MRPLSARLSALRLPLGILLSLLAQPLGAGIARASSEVEAPEAADHAEDSPAAHAHGSGISEDAPADEDLHGPTDEELRRLKWSGYGLPYVSANSTNGFIFGAAGEIFARDRDSDYGYDVKLTPSTLITTDLSYNSHFLQIEVRRWVHLLARFGYQGWTDMAYGGVGGAAAVRDLGDLETGNGLKAPYGMAAVSLQPPGRSVRTYGQVYLRQAWPTPREGGWLEMTAPPGIDGGFYADMTLGLEFDDIDRWPLPIQGSRGEVDFRAGGTFSPDGFMPVAGPHAEIFHWRPLAPQLFGERMVLGARLLGSTTVGQLPWFEQGFTGGRWRDELGFEQAFAGYGRLRTRGDGMLAAMVELRPQLFAINHGFWQIDAYLSLAVEEGFLMERFTLGPHLPTLVASPILVWKGASVIRPYVAVGYRAEIEGGPRTPSPQFGLSVDGVL